MRFDTVLLDAPGKAADRRLWPNRTPCDLLDEAVAARPDRLAIAEHRADRPAPVRLTYRELGATVDALARALGELGVGHGDVVAIQLPNWWQFFAVALACGRVGAATNVLMPIFRERELTHMLRLCEAKVAFVPRQHRGFDHAAMFAGLRPSLPALEHVVVVDGEGEQGFEALLARGRAAAAEGRPVAARPLAPDDVLLLMYTSGTTGEPKGVMHTSNTVGATMEALRERLRLEEGEVVLTASPVGHLLGYLTLGMLPIMLKGTIVLQDVWEPRRAVELMAAEGVTFTAASTPFLSDLCGAVDAGVPRPPRLRLFMCSGAPIPSALIERALRSMDLTVVSCFGTTEVGSCSITEPEQRMKAATSDGRAVRGVETRIVDEDGTPVRAGTPGRLLVRGATLFGGYLKRPELNNTTADGWFDTGDLAHADAEGYVRICGRTKDIIIRGGENVPVVEIENLIFRHPAVAEVAVVGYPDERLGERACAFVVTKRGQAFDLAELRRWLETNRVTRQYWPERVERVDALPRTATGKIQKFKLRETAKAFAREHP